MIYLFIRIRKFQYISTQHEICNFWTLFETIICFYLKAENMCRKNIWNNEAYGLSFMSCTQFILLVRLL